MASPPSKKGPRRVHNAPGNIDQLDAFVVAAAHPRPTEKRTAAEIIAAVSAQPEEAGRARKTDPFTSHLGGDTVDLKGLQLMVVKALAEHGPMTTYELANLFDRLRQNVSPAIAPLCDNGHVEAGGSVIWEVTGKRNIKWRLRTGWGPYCPECNDGVIAPGPCHKCAKKKERADKAQARADRKGAA